MLITKGLQMAAGNRGLMESIANKMASDESGNEVFVHKLSPGERAIWMQRVRSVIDGFTEQLK